MNKFQLSAWVRDWLVLSAAVMFATWATTGIACNRPLTLMLVAATISLLNTFLRPLLLLLAFPFMVATFGLGAILVLWLINSFFLYFSGSLFADFHVAGFSSAMVGAIFISVAQFFLNLLFGIKRPGISIFGAGTSPRNSGDTELPRGDTGRDPFPQQNSRSGTRSRTRREEDDGDVIDI